MQFNNTTSQVKNGILQVCESLSGLGDGGITSDDNLKANFVNYVNIAIGEVRMAIMEVDKQWKSNDYNYTDLADAPITLVASQRDYELPVASTGAPVATLLRVNRVYIEKNDTRTYLRPLESAEDVSDGDGVPMAYRLIGKTIWFDVAPSASFVSNYVTFHVEYQRLDDPFVFGDTTQVPGFLGTYHHLLCFRASCLYLYRTNPALAAIYKQEFDTGLVRLKADVVRMLGDGRTAMTSENITHR